MCIRDSGDRVPLGAKAFADGEGQAAGTVAFLEDEADA